MNQKKLIAAHEIGQYIYCKRCWWKEINGFNITTPQMIKGQSLHNQTFEKISSWNNTSNLIKFILLILVFTILFLVIFKLLFYL